MYPRIGAGGGRGGGGFRGGRGRGIRVVRGGGGWGGWGWPGWGWPSYWPTVQTSNVDAVRAAFNAWQSALAQSAKTPGAPPDATIEALRQNFFRLLYGG